MQLAMEVEQPELVGSEGLADAAVVETTV